MKRKRADEDDLELLYSRYPSTEYEILSIDKIIKDEEEKEDIISKPKIYKVTINMRDPQQQAKFRAELLNHHKKCIISGKSNTTLIDGAHIMPFKQVGSCLKTGILLRKKLHWLWDRYDISIDPQTWIVHLSKKLQDDVRAKLGLF
jgi:putative restriction endonuclease